MSGHIKNFLLKYRANQKSVNRVLRLSMLMPYLMLTLVFVILHAFNVMQYKKDAIKSHLLVAKYAAKSIQQTDQYTEQIIYNALLAWSGTGMFNSLEKLEKLKDGLGVSRLGIIGADGMSTDMDTRKTDSFAKKLDIKFKGDPVYYSIFKSTCEEYRALQKPDLQNKPIITPVVFATMRKIPVKWGLMFDAKLGQYLYAEYSRDFFTNILQDIAATNPAIDYINISDPHGNPIAAFGDSSKYTFGKDYKSFSEKPIITENGGSISVTHAFSKNPANAIETCFLQHNKDRTDQDGTYFYVLNINFSKANLHRGSYLVSLSYFLLFIVTLAAGIFSKNFLQNLAIKTMNKGDQ